MSHHTLYLNIRRIRELRGLCQSYVAQQLGICNKTYSRIENGITDITFSRLMMIAEILDVSVTDIIDFNPEIWFRKSNS